MKKFLLGLAAVPFVVLQAPAYSQDHVTTQPAAATTAAKAAESALRSDHPQSYTVVKGDTLWAIAGRFLNEPWMWKKLWHINPQIQNPHLIYPGDTIKLVYINGEPKLTVERGANATTSVVDPNCGDTGNHETKMSDGTVKISPKCRAISLEEAIKTIPLDSLAPFLSENRIMTIEEIAGTPRVLSGSSEHIVTGAGDIIYARGKFAADIPAYGIYREGQVYKDPETGESLGLEMRGMGVAKLVTTEGDVATLKITRSREEIIGGDKVIPTEESKVESSFFPQAPDVEVKGYILDVLGGVSQVAQFNAVVISKGKRDGLEPGAVLKIYNKGALVKDPETGETIQLPPEEAGLLMVFRSFEKVSYAIILKSTNAMSVGDIVKTP